MFAWVAETVLREEVVVCTIVPAWTGSSNICSAELLRKPALLDYQADLSDYIVYLQLHNFTKFLLQGKFP